MSMHENVLATCFKFLTFLKYTRTKITNFRGKNFFKNECCKPLLLSEFNIVSLFMTLRSKIEIEIERNRLKHMHGFTLDELG